MKKNYFTITFICLFSFLMQAQDFNGKIIISAAANGYSEFENHIKKDLKTSQFNYTFNLSGGYFISDNSSLGIYSGLERRVYKMIEPDSLHYKTIQSKYEIGLYYKKYYQLVNRFYLTLMLSPNFSRETYKRSSVLEPNPFFPTYITRINLSFVPGISLDITDKLSVDANIGVFTLFVQYNRRDDPTLSEDNRTYINLMTDSDLNRFRISSLMLDFSYKIDFK